MKRKITICTICFVALIAWTGLAFAQTATPSAIKTVKLPTGEEVYDLTGEWEALIDNFGEWVRFGRYKNVLKITLDGSSFIGTRLKDDGSSKPTGSLIVLFGLDKSGFQNVILNTGAGPFPCNGTISKDGNTILIDLDDRASLTLIRK